MNFTARARNFWACVSITFNQAVHFGNAPYPLSFSETCYLRQDKRRYSIGMKVVDGIFKLFGEFEHCKNSYINGMVERRRYT